MDVTSLLNSTSLGKEGVMGTEVRSMVDHVIGSTSTCSRTEGTTTCSSISEISSNEKTPSRRTSDTKIPSRSRTPWDANGYALPLTLDTKSTQVPGRQVSNSTSPAESTSPKSPRHKFSDSHSSLSSYASSSTSLSHSRISSMSTVGGVQSINTIPDTPSLETQFECAELAVPKIWSSESRRRTTKEGLISPPVTTINGEPLVTDLLRTSSPSDAMLMSRGTQSLDQIKRPDPIITKDIRPDLSHLVPLDFTKAHKRAISAPDFAATDTINRGFPSFANTIQPTSSPSHRVEHRLGYAMTAMSPSPALAEQPSQDGIVVCMYKPNCDTGSQLRKAISHIFGRNKTCTRNIPSHVWVHFCRKHYQRSRYRNAQEWARVQCDLVQKQIRRVQDWSDENKRTGQPGIVQEWSLSMRKREQNRVQEKSNRKRSYRDDSEDDDDVGTLDSATLNGTAVPDWLRTKCGDGYSTAEIEEIVARLKREMEETNMTQIPDIEILPNISMDASNDARPKTMLKRKTSGGSHTHKRSQSVGVSLRPEAQPMTRRVSQPAYWRNEDAMHTSPVEKRQRVSDAPPYGDRHARMNLRHPDRPALAPLRDTYSIPHRPAFNNIQESHAEESYYSREDADIANSSYDHWSATASQRNGGQPTVPTLDSSTSREYLNGRRASHQRSFSEVDNQHNFTFRSPLDYPSMPSSQFSEATAYDRVPMSLRHSHTSHASHPPSSYYDSSSGPNHRNAGHYQPPWQSPQSGHASSYSGYRHMRHQSTPTAPHSSIAQIPSIEYEHANGARQAPAYEQTSPYHRRQQSYAPSRQFPHRPVVQESDQAKAVFGERR
ncbi:uncharacterized protein F4807DRAFT_400978 [Annulohypoxylon truncatum]|uniref:uncharacterized protein n=1 Tax=Annulohypoxylon truncatum TaxID=327061 RepID=UPI002007FD41|nr:uncharacterized protein F4807DRAFT_400978 [Annulohypoxylon truncatum]KAI1211758.1 hypothetical protein F4807DRAFT_400978 [Annulohypoxylon truncatum]